MLRHDSGLVPQWKSRRGCGQQVGKKCAADDSPLASDPGSGGQVRYDAAQCGQRAVLLVPVVNVGGCPWLGLLGPIGAGPGQPGYRVAERPGGVGQWRKLLP